MSQDDHRCQAARQQGRGKSGKLKQACWFNASADHRDIGHSDKHKGMQGCKKVIKGSRLAWPSFSLLTTACSRVDANSTHIQPSNLHAQPCSQKSGQRQRLLRPKLQTDLLLIHKARDKARPNKNWSAFFLTDAWPNQERLTAQ